MMRLVQFLILFDKQTLLQHFDNFKIVFFFFWGGGDIDRNKINGVTDFILTWHEMQMLCKQIIYLRISGLQKGSIVESV